MVRSSHSAPHAGLQAILGATVKNRRQRLGLTQEELAWRANMHRTYLADIERGVRNVTLRTLGALATALEVPVSALLVQPGDETRSLRGTKRELIAPRMGEIVLIDPNLQDVDLTLRVFREAKFTNPIRVFHDGEKALDHLLREGNDPLPQLVLLDLKLPKVSGLEVLRRMRGDPRTRGIPVVILLVSRQDDGVHESRRLGAEHFVLKPMAFESLHHAAPKLGLQWALLTPPEGEGG